MKSRLIILFCVTLLSVAGIGIGMFTSELTLFDVPVFALSIMIVAVVGGLIMSVKQNGRDVERGAYHNGTYFTFGMALGLGAGASFEFVVGSYPIIGRDIWGLSYLAFLVVFSLAGLLV